MKLLLGLLFLPLAVDAASYLDGSFTTRSAGASPAEVVLADSPANDAFGRLRVSNPVTLLDTKQLRDKQPLVWDEEIGGGAAASNSVHVATNAATVVSVDAAGEYVVRQTFMRANYQPGKSQQILMTFTLGETTPGVTKRVGYFNSSTNTPYSADFDGLYLEDNGTNLAFCVAKTGSITRIPQASWNLDKLDGTGSSGVTLDPSKAQIFFMDFEWLGTGRVRFGFVLDGQIVVCHKVNSANVADSVYMSSPNHSLRYEIRSNGGTGSLMQICSTASSEGGSQFRGLVFSDSGNNQGVTTAAEDVTYAVHGLRLKQTAPDGVLAVLGKTLLMTTSTEVAQWELRLNPTVAGTFTYSSPSVYSVSETAIGATANIVTGGTLLAHGRVATGNNQAGASLEQSALQSFLRPGLALNGDADEVVLCIRPIVGSSVVTVYGGLLWAEQ